jgi:hypothetical protein
LVGRIASCASWGGGIFALVFVFAVFDGFVVFYGFICV